MKDFDTNTNPVGMQTNFIFLRIYFEHQLWKYQINVWMGVALVTMRIVVKE